MRHWKLLLIVVVVAVAARLGLHRPVAVELDLGYGGAVPALREADLVFTGADDHVEGELKLLYPSGAPLRDHRAVRLHSGHYVVGARLRYDGQPERTLSRPLEIDQPGTYSVDF